MKEYEELGHMEPVTSQEGKNTCYYLPHHPVFKETSSTTKTRVVFDGGAKTSNGLSLNDMIQEETASATWRHVPTQSNPADLISRGINPSTLSASALWWKGPSWLSKAPYSWPTTELNIPTENLEIRNVHVALLQPPEDITQQFSKLNRLIRVVAHCTRFINNCRHSKATKQTSTPTTQDLDQALTCCVKMVQQISYAQEMKKLKKKKQFPLPVH
jgi:hypothetical protein